MRTMHKLTALSAAVIVGMGAVTWSANASACGAEDYISSICVMASTRTDLTNYHVADGSQLTIQSYAALYSLIGVTYGGDAQRNFNIPDLRGRVIVGVDNRTPAFSRLGTTGGNVQTTLTLTQLPAHMHSLKAAAVAWAPGTLTATTTLNGLSATTTMNGVTATVAGSGFTLKAYSGSAGASTASGGALATPAGPTNKIYAGNAPDVAMAAGSISGSAPVAFNGNPTTMVTGSAATALTGAPAIALSGNTDATGMVSPANVPTMPPYLALNYYISTLGLYPQFDN